MCLVYGDVFVYCWLAFLYHVFGLRVVGITVSCVDIRVLGIAVSYVGIIMVCWYNCDGYLCIVCLDNGCWLAYWLWIFMYRVLG